MFFAGHRYRRSERSLKDLEFAATQALARGGRAADGAVMLDEQQVVAAVDDLGEVALGGSLLAKRPHSQFSGTARKRCLIRRELLRRAVVDDVIERIVAERGANGFDEIDGEFAVAVGKELAGQCRSAPVQRWSPAANIGALEALDEPRLLQRFKVLANCSSGGAELVGELFPGAIIGALERFNDSALGVGELGHLGQPNGFRKSSLC